MKAFLIICILLLSTLLIFTTPTSARALVAQSKTRLISNLYDLFILSCISVI
ncbi:hypothetical protein DITRI_Ditri05aG0062100 [Diplodiscus trichospermus]